MATQTDKQVNVLWPAAKEQLAELVTDVYRKIGYLDVKSPKPLFPIYDLGHPNRGLTDFPKILTLSEFESCNPVHGASEIPSLKVEISAQKLLGQLHQSIIRYLAATSDPTASFYDAHLKSLAGAIEASDGIRIRLDLEGIMGEASTPEYDLAAYHIF